MIVNIDNAIMFEDLISDENRMMVMRSYRDKYLTNSDWTQIPDSRLTNDRRQARADYRQALRDFPATWTPAETAEFPDPPEAN